MPQQSPDSIFYNNQRILIKNLVKATHMQKFHSGDPMSIKLPISVTKHLKSGKIFNLDYEVCSLKDLEEIARRAKKTAQKVGLKTIDPMGICTYALEDIIKGSSIPYTGSIFLQSNNAPLKNNDYALRCTENDSPKFVYVDAKDIGSIARFTAHLPDKEKLDEYHFLNAVSKKNIATSNLDFEIYWYYDKAKDLIYVLPLQTAKINIHKDDGLGVDYDCDYWNNLTGADGIKGVEPVFIDIKTSKPIKKEDWELKRQLVRVSNRLYLSFEINKDTKNIPEWVLGANIARTCSVFLNEYKQKPRLAYNPLELSLFMNNKKYASNDGGYANFLQALKHLKDKQYKHAIGELQRALKLMPLAPIYYFALSQACYQLYVEKNNKRHKNMAIDALKNHDYLMHYIQNAEIGVIEELEDDMKTCHSLNASKYFKSWEEVLKKMHDILCTEATHQKLHLGKRMKLDFFDTQDTLRKKVQKNPINQESHENTLPLFALINKRQGMLEKMKTESSDEKENQELIDFLERLIKNQDEDEVLPELDRHNVFSMR